MPDTEAIPSPSVPPAKASSPQRTGGGLRNPGSGPVKGKLRGHLLPQSHRSHRHRPRARVAPENAPDAKRRKTTSDTPPQPSVFAKLHTTVNTAESIDDYLEQHRKNILSDPKTLQTFLSATLSGRPDEVFLQLVTDFKKTVFDLLFALYSLCTTGKMSLRPPSHEFVIRCEVHGVRRAEWEAELVAAHGVDTTLITPKAMLKRLGQLDPVGRLQRLMEMSSTPSDLHKCARKLFQYLVPTEEDARAPGSSSGDTSEKSDNTGKTAAGEPLSAGTGGITETAYTIRCQLLSKFVSKLRRVAGDTGAAAAVEDHPELEPQGEQSSLSEPKGSTTTPLWSEEEAELLCECGTVAADILEHLLAQKPASSTQTPITKLLKYAEWAKPLGLLRAQDRTRITEMDRAAQESLEQTAAQMEVVVRLKSVQTGDHAALEPLLNELWEAGGQESFSPCSSDVLSSIATTTVALGVPEKLQKETARRLLATQHKMKAAGMSPHQLPRRAMRFVSTVLQKERQEASSEVRAAVGATRRE